MGFELAENAEGVVNIKVIGCGGGGCNAVNRALSLLPQILICR